MNEYFKPLRRTIGAISLAFACAFTVAWVRSVNKTDSAFFPVTKSCTLQLISNAATLTIRRFESPYRVKPLMGTVDRIGLVGAVKLDETTTADYETTLDESLRSKSGNPYKWTVKFWGIEYGHLDVKGSSLRVTVCKTPYWSIVILLTMLSAYLLLSRPRSKTGSTQPSAADCTAHLNARDAM